MAGSSRLAPTQRYGYINKNISLKPIIINDKLSRMPLIKVNHEQDISKSYFERWPGAWFVSQEVWVGGTLSHWQESYKSPYGIYTYIYISPKPQFISCGIEMCSVVL